jgi:AcrR family transcriptional regulator
MPSRAIGTGRTGGIRRQRALETRRRVVKAAYRLFCRRGFAATTMNQIAAEASNRQDLWMKIF